MNNSKPLYVIKRLFFFLLIFSGILLWIYCGSGRKQMGEFYRVNGNYWLSDFGGGGEVSMKKYNESKGQFDTMIWLTSKPQKERALAKARREGKKEATFTPVKFPIDSWANSCLLYAFFIALILAAPTSLKRKFIGLFVGLPIIYFFVYFKIWLSILLKFSKYYDNFEVGFSSALMINILNYIYLIVIFPYFGLVLCLLLCLSLIFWGRAEILNGVRIS